MSRIHDALRRADPEQLVEYPDDHYPRDRETAGYSPLLSHPAVMVFRKRIRLFCAVAGGFFLFCAIVVLCLPKKYESEMKLLVKNERQDLVVSPETNVSTVHQSEISESQINSEIELLRSTDVLRKVALESGLSKPEAGTVQAAGEISPVSLDKALVGLERDITISPVKKSDIIDVVYTSKIPEQASKVLKSLEENYLMAHLKMHANPGTLAFFDQQAQTYQERLAESEERLKKFREQNNFPNAMPDHDDIVATRAIEAQTALEQVDAEIADNQQRIARGESALKSLNARVATQQRVVPESQLVQSLGQTLNQLQNHRTELVLKFNSDDPFVAEIDKEIADTTLALERARSEKSEESSSDINPVRQNTEGNMVTSQVALSGLMARRTSLAGVVEGYKHKMYGLANASVDYESLVRQRKENEDNYLLYQKKREEARIAESLDLERITNVAVIQAPVTPLQPSGPKTKLDLLLSFICALFVAGTTILLAEYLTPKPGSAYPTRREIAAPASSVVPAATSDGDAFSAGA